MRLDLQFLFIVEKSVLIIYEIVEEQNKLAGGYSGGVTPVPIPNTEVKPSCADGTCGATHRESRSSPAFF